ncbi:hypothetical protein M0R89_17635 [Halorussus limi]|uniref:Uncharacterized protein n=1 Tax=Halorussus limi TaxID=2938695 RepID=A0A8U0HTB1_9EURY|nr:hypothetical protein [Halorussus limi]UPV74342.1 hypothetical protein M0R89_17635 [Halorussus limi]
MKRATQLLLAFAVVLSLTTPVAAGSDAVPARDARPVADWDDDGWGEDDSDDGWGGDDGNDCENEEMGYDHHPTCIDTDPDTDFGTNDGAEVDGAMIAGSPSSDDDISNCRSLGEKMASYRNGDTAVEVGTKWHAVVAYGDCVRQNTDDDEEDGLYYND